MTTLSLLIPTHREQRPLRRCLESVVPQLEAGDEVLVIGDTHDGPLPGVEAVCEDYALFVRYLSHDAGAHDWGHSQLNHGLAQAQGDYVHCQDDDDVYTPDALAAMRAASAEHGMRPYLFRFKSYHGDTWWQDEAIAEGRVGGHCAVFPNDERLGRFTARYNGDWDYIASTLANWLPTPPVFVDRLICVARP